MKLRYYNILLGFLILGACNKVEVTEPEFEVEAVSTTVKVNQEVDFRFKGDPYQISFYSGEILNDYAHKEGRKVISEGLDLSFTTAVQYGAQANQFSILASTDFSGNYTMEDINAATWIDITNSHPLSTSTTQLMWGPKDLQSLLVEDKPIYVAFKYVTLPQTANGVQRTWYVRSFSLKSNTNIGTTVELANQVTAGFTLVHDGPLEPSRSSSTATTVTLRGNNLAANKEIKTEDWAITKAISVGSTELGPDRSAPIKGFADTRSSEYKYAYTKPGVYKATFIASNSSAYGGKSVIREIEITVTE